MNIKIVYQSDTHRKRTKTPCRQIS